MVVGASLRGQKRNVTVLAVFNQVVGGGQIVREQNRRHATGEQFFEMVCSPARIETGVVIHLFATKYLNARGVDEIQVTDQVGCGHTVIRNQAIRGRLTCDPFETNVFDIVIHEVLHRQHSGSIVG